MKEENKIRKESSPSSSIEKSTFSNRYLPPITEKFDDFSTN
jgi:hypothetical protein